MPELRDYQKELLEKIEKYLATEKGNPCVMYTI